MFSGLYLPMKLHKETMKNKKMNSHGFSKFQHLVAAQGELCTRNHQAAGMEVVRSVRVWV